MEMRSAVGEGKDCFSDRSTCITRPRHATDRAKRQGRHLALERISLEIELDEVRQLAEGRVHRAECRGQVVVLEDDAHHDALRQVGSSAADTTARAAIWPHQVRFREWQLLLTVALAESAFEGWKVGRAAGDAIPAVDARLALQPIRGVDP